MSEDSAGRRLGIVVSGSLASGLKVKLDPGVSVEELKEGVWVTIMGSTGRFFGLIGDIGLEAIDPQFAVTPPDVSDPFVAAVVAGTATFGTIQVRPYLVYGLDGLEPAKTVPQHFAVAREASAEEVELVFGKEDEKHFWVGSPLDLEAKVNLDLEALVKRSNGVFGKSGTGKTFLARLLLAGIIQKDVATCLIFDMQNEYGWQSRSEDRRFP
ncbi:MAG TPA: DUF87 domain-containing protein, partial [Dehalococcoidia bacterium]|nr:DUF87 domain-containing protein [Dehalococcoidia bacterium]